MNKDDPVLHPGVVRLTHWLWAIAVIMLLMSGMRIYNSEPIFDFYFPVWMTLGGSLESANKLHNDFGLAGALLWHFAAIWPLFIALLVFLVYGIVKGHFRMKYWPVTPAQVIRDITDFFKGRLFHNLGVRNAVQKLLYAFAILDMIVMVASGIVLWKPVQFHTLGLLMGQYEGARYVHFIGMAAMAGFIFVHLALVLLVPKVLLPMITGRAPHTHFAKPDIGAAS